MRGCLKIAVIAVGLILILGAIISLLLLNHAHIYLKDKFIESIRQTVNTSLTAEKIQVSPLRRQIVISGLAIGNPGEFKTANAIELPKVTIDVDAATLFSKSPVIKRVHVDGAQFFIRHEAGKGTNIAMLARIVEMGRQASGTDRKFIVEECVFENGKVKLTSNALPVPLSEISLPALTLRGEKEKPMGLNTIIAGYLNALLKQLSDEKALQESMSTRLKDFFMPPARSN